MMLTYSSSTTLHYVIQIRRTTIPMLMKLLVNKGKRRAWGALFQANDSA